MLRNDLSEHDPDIPEITNPQQSLELKHAQENNINTKHSTFTDLRKNRRRLGRRRRTM